MSSQLDQHNDLLNAVKTLLRATPGAPHGAVSLGAGLERGTIRPATAERIAVAVAEANGCAYSLAAHTHLGEHVTRLDPVELRRNRRFESADPKAHTILSFARVVLQSRGSVSDADVDAARAAGLSDAELADTVGHVALNVLTNLFYKTFQLEVDLPLLEPTEGSRMAA